jgi:hypothetical protein
VTDNSDDPFGQPSTSQYPKPEELEGSLLMFRPSKPADTVPNRFAKRPEDPSHVQRISVDTTVFGPDGVEEYPDMYWSQQVIIRACEQALKPGAKPFVLGRLVKVATKDTREKLKIGETPDDFAAANAEWLRKGGKGTQPRYVWILDQFTDEDAAVARAYVASLQKQRDPFAASTAAGE